MKKFLPIIVFLFNIAGIHLFGGSPGVTNVAYTFCSLDISGEQIIKHDVIPLHVVTASTDCNNPTNITSISDTDFLNGGTSYYYSVDLAAGKVLYLQVLTLQSSPLIVLVELHLWHLFVILGERLLSLE